MARFAAGGFNQMQPLILVLHVGRDTVAVGTSPGKFIFLGHLEERVPVFGRIELRGGFGVGRNGWFQIDCLAGFGFNLGRVDEAVAAGPHRVLGFGEIGNEIPAAIVGDDLFDVPSGQAGSFGNDPNTGFRSLGAGNYAANVVGVDLDSVCLLLRVQDG